MPEAPVHILGSGPPPWQSRHPGEGVPSSWGHPPWPWKGCRCPQARCSGNSWLLRQGWWPGAGVCTWVFACVWRLCLCVCVCVCVCTHAGGAHSF